MGRQQQQQQQQQSLRSKAAHFVSDLTTVILNPISDKPSKPSAQSPSGDRKVPEGDKVVSNSEEDSGDIVEGPDTSSFSAFIYSLLSSSESGTDSKYDGKNEYQEDSGDPPVPILTESGRKKSLLSRGKQSLGRAVRQVGRLGGFRSQAVQRGKTELVVDNDSDLKANGGEEIAEQNSDEASPSDILPEASEPSLLLSEKTRSVLYAALPVLVKARKWVLLYSTWRHGISLSTLYRRSMLWPGISLLVVGDGNGAVFGGLVEAPLRPTNKRYQGTNSSFVFTNISGKPAIFRPTGVNHYYTLCSPEYIALGGGNHFALYLDGDLLTGSSSACETYGNSCLAFSEDFKVKEVELWGFVYASNYEEMLSLLKTEAPGICRW